MTLQNLLAIHRLQALAPDAGAIRKLLEAARRNLADAQVAQISTDNRFDAAYKCIMQCAMLGLWGNLSDYEGDPVSAPTLASCVAEADKLLAHTQAWLKNKNPQWADPAA